MKRGIILIVFGVLLFGANIFLAIRYNKTAQALKLCMKERGGLIEKNNFFFEKEKIQFNLNRNAVNDTMFYDQEGWPTYKKSTPNDIVVFFYSEFHCRICVDGELIRINKVITEKNKQNFVLFANYRNEKDFRLFLRLNQVDFNYFRVKDGLLKNNTATNKSPIYFVLDKNGTIHEAFIPQKEFPGLTDNYLGSVFKD